MRIGDIIFTPIINHTIQAIYPDRFGACVEKLQFEMISEDIDR